MCANPSCPQWGPQTGVSVTPNPLLPPFPNLVLHMEDTLCTCEAYGTRSTSEKHEARNKDETLGGSRAWCSQEAG